MTSKPKKVWTQDDIGCIPTFGKIDSPKTCHLGLTKYVFLMDFPTTPANIHIFCKRKHGILKNRYNMDVNKIIVYGMCVVNWCIASINPSIWAFNWHRWLRISLMSTQISLISSECSWILNSKYAPYFIVVEQTLTRVLVS